jgi:hypothetical protein
MWWEHWFDNEMSSLIEGIVAQGVVKAEDGRLRLLVHDTVKPYWSHIAGSTDCRNCALWNDIFFKRLGVIHSFCRYHCWKVVTKPRTVKELIQMHNLMYVIPFEYNFINPLPGKAGLDVRPYTNSPFATFNYCTSLVEGLRVKEILLHMITKYMPNDKIDGKHLQDTVFLKRSCTEMESKIPTTDVWWDTPQSRDEWEIEHRLEEIFMCEPDMHFQPAWLKDKVLQNWLNHANSIGDKSIADFIGADIFTVNSRKYVAKDLQLKGGDEEKVEVPKEKKESKRSKTKEKK